MDDVEYVRCMFTELGSLFMFYVSASYLVSLLGLIIFNTHSVINVLFISSLVSLFIYISMPIIYCLIHNPISLANITYSGIESRAGTIERFYAAIRYVITRKRFTREQGFVFWPWLGGKMFVLAYRANQYIERELSEIE